MLAFTVLWVTVIYFPMAHMVWGKGGFLNATLGGRVPALDFAGGTVVHIASGFSALVCAIYMGKRIGYPKTMMAPHSLVLSFIGACMLWVGWFGFNAGSALSAGALATSAFTATHFAAAAGTLGWVAAEWVRHGKPTVLGAISGAVCGLVGITPASGFVDPIGALVIGVAAGVGCFFASTFVKNKLGYDDALDAFGVHGVGGTIGALLTGVFATMLVKGGDAAVGLIDGNAAQLWIQLKSIIVTMLFCGVGTAIILKVIDVTVGLRVPEEVERDGLDLALHGEAVQ